MVMSLVQISHFNSPYMPWSSRNQSI